MIHAAPNGSLRRVELKYHHRNRVQRPRPSTKHDGERTSIVSASQPGKLVAPLVFQGSCNTGVVDKLPASAVPLPDNRACAVTSQLLMSFWLRP